MANPYSKQTWTDGVSSASAARMGAIEQGIFDAHFPPCCLVQHSTTQSITTSGTAQAVTFDTELQDQDGLGTSTMHSTGTNPTRVIAKVAGTFNVQAWGSWPSSPSNARIGIRINGTDTRYTVFVPADFREMMTGGLIVMAVNDYVEMMVTQFSGGALNLSAAPRLSAYRVG